MSDDYTRMSGPQRRRLLDAVLARDGWVCCICGLTIAPGDESLQHKTPRSRGGVTSLLDPSSLGPAHKRCNYAAGARAVEGPASIVHSGLTYFVRPDTDVEQR
jgi:5-methylcytosine-specific restriction endonuclease McrA